MISQQQIILSLKQSFSLSSETKPFSWGLLPSCPFQTSLASSFYSTLSLILKFLKACFQNSFLSHPIFSLIVTLIIYVSVTLKFIFSVWMSLSRVSDLCIWPAWYQEVSQRLQDDTSQTQLTMVPATSFSNRYHNKYCRHSQKFKSQKSKHNSWPDLILCSPYCYHCGQSYLHYLLWLMLLPPKEYSRHSVFRHFHCHPSTLKNVNFITSISCSKPLNDFPLWLE